jgi:hypothetical protein
VRLAAAGSLLLALVMGSHASAQSLDAAAKASDELGVRVQFLRSQYVTVAEFRSQNDAVTKIADAQLRYRISDWDSASILLAQVVDEPRYAASAGLRDAKFMLADSLFHLRNFDLAKKHFRDLVATKDANYALKSARRLLEMAYIDGDYSDLDAMFSEFANSDMGNFGPDIAYMRGKAQYGQGNYEAALASFSGVKGAAILEFRAAYFAGVTRARLGQFEESRQAFEAVIQQLAKKKGEAEREILNLSRLGRARIYYEQKQFGVAIEAYGEVDPNSPQYKASLFEQAWCFQREGRTRDAILSLQRLQIYASNDAELRYYLPEAGLLIGDFQLRENRYQEATASFARVIRAERPDVAGVDQILASQSDPAAFLKLLVNEVDGHLELPAFAQPFFVQDRELKHALDISNDLAQASVNVADSELALAELDTGINSRSRVNIFPEMRDGWARGIELEMDSLQLLIASINAERTALADKLPAEAVAELDKLRAERAALETSYRAQPRSFAEMTQRQEVSVKQIRALSVDLFSVKQDLETSIRETKELRETIADNQRLGKISPALAQRQRASLEENAGELNRRLDTVAVLQRDIAARSVEVGVADDVSASERDLRVRFRDSLRREAQILANYRQVAPSSSALFAQADDVRANVDRGQAALDAYFTDIERAVDTKIADLRVVLSEEQARMATIRTTLDTLRSDGARLTGSVAQASFGRVRDRLNGIMMRANIGVLDVAWQQKEELTKEIGELVRRRQDALSIIDADFEEILKGQ